MIGLNSPKRVLREALASQMIKNEEFWLVMLEDRNSMAHIYNEYIALKICTDIQEKYVHALGELIEEIRKRLGD